MLKRGKPGRHCQRISRQSTRLVHIAQRSHAAHDVFLSCKSSNGKSTADNFSERNKVRIDLVNFLCSALRKPEARHHLVEDQHDTITCTLLAKHLQEASLRRNAAHVTSNRFNNNGRDLATLLRQKIENFF